MEPKIKSFGCFKILEKSDTVKDKPSENIIKISDKGKKILIIITI